MRAIPDLSYGPHPQNRIDLYLPENGPAPDLFLFFHGGGFVGGSRKYREPAYGGLVRSGVAVATADYRMYPEAAYPDFVEDAALACAWVKENIARYAPVRRIFLGGSSAGGYLTQMLCFDASWLGRHHLKPSDFAGFFHDAGQPTAHFNVLKERGLDSRRVIVDETAPLYHVGTDTDLPPMHFVVSDNDIPVRYEQTMVMISALKDFGFDPGRVTYEVRHGGHTQYCKELDEDGNSVYAEMILRFIQSV